VLTELHARLDQVIALSAVAGRGWLTARFSASKREETR
jgi:hypothetical protein